MNPTRILSAILLTGCVACAPVTNMNINEDANVESNVNANVETNVNADVEVSLDTIVISVDVIKLRNDDGVVQVTLYDKEDDFLSEDSKTMRQVRVPIESNKATCEFAGVKPGKYAVALMHDEDSDGKMKKNLVGMPREGIGMSNDAKPKFGPPKWKDAVFSVEDEDLTLEITLLYF